MKKTKKALASLAIAGMVLSMAPMSVFAADASDRIFGADRIETAVKVAQAGWTTAATVIVAPAADANLVDALAAAPLAGQEKAPILLTDGAMLDAKTKQAIVDLKATKVYAVGALSAQVVTDLQGISGVTVEALKGADRIETATKIVAKLAAPAGSFVVGYNALADALSVASFAAANNYSILVANPDGTLPASEVAVGTKYTVGGPTLVADVAGATRLYGLDRFETNQKVLNALSYSYGKVYVANGEDAHLVDSLVGSSLAAQNRAAIVLGDTVSAKAAADVSAKLTSGSQVIALGGTSLVPDSVKNSVMYNVPAILSVTNVTVLNAKQVQVTFNKAVKADTVLDDKGTAKTSDDTLKNITFTTVDGATVTSANCLATLDSTGTVLTISAAGSEYFNKKYVVTVPTAVTDLDGKEVAKYVQVLTASDDVRPVVTTTEYTANGQIFKLTLSEKIKSYGTIKLKDADGKDYIAEGDATVSFTAPSSKVEVNIADKDIPTGKDLTLTMMGAVDYMENIISPNPYTATVVKGSEDNTDPTVSSVEFVNDKEFKITFAERLNGSTSSVNAVGAPFVQANGVTPSAISVDDSKLVYTYTMASSMVASGDSALVTLLVKDYADLAGNVGDNYSKAYVVSKDAAKPVLESNSVTKLDGKEFLILTFNENVTTQSGIAFVGVADKFIKDSVETAITSADTTKLLATSSSNFALYNAVDSKSHSVKLDISTLAAGTYKITLKAGTVQDSSGNGNASVSSFTFVRGTDSLTDKPELITTYDGNGVKADASKTITLNFNQKLDLDSLNVSNFNIEGVAVKSAIFTQNDTTSSVIKLSLAAGSNTANGYRTITVSGVKNTSGVVMNTKTVTENLTENVAPTVKAVTLQDTQNIKIEFSEAINTVVSGDFEVYVGTSSTAKPVSGVSVAADKKSVVITLSSALSVDDYSKDIKVQAADANAVVDANSNALDFDSVIVSK